MAEVKKTETRSGVAATPNVRKEMRKTGSEPSAAVGDHAKRDAAEARTTTTRTSKDSSHPKGTNKEVWAEAERAATNMGGLNGVDDKARKDLIQVQYDKMVASDRQTKEWAFGSDKVEKGGILGDTK